MTEWGRPSLDGRRVLVVEDDVDLRDMVALMLQESGCLVEAASNGKEALDRFEACRPDLVLLDMRMPVMNGWEFVDEMRARFGGNGELPPVVVMTAAEDARQRAAEVSAVAWVSKPFDIDELLGTIDAHVERNSDHS